MDVLFISLDNFSKFLENSSKEFDCFLPVKQSSKTGAEKEYRSYEKFTPSLIDKAVIGEIRPSEPIKSFLTYSKERLDTLSERKQLIFGVKNCDLNSLPIQDFVFKDNDPPDPFYIQKRNNTYIISSDCDLLYENCFCTASGSTPYPETGFDLNFSSGINGYLVDVGSDKGRGLVGKNEGLFTKAQKRQIEERDARRKEFTAELTKKVSDKGVPNFDYLKDKVQKNYNSELWEETAKTCIECGACNLGCPTCHCFIISDQKKGNLARRYRLWDACLYKRFAVVAGGANPRRHLAERLRNRFDKKFDFFPKVLNKYACTGCGRCFEACPGEIDIREVLKKLVK